MRKQLERDIAESRNECSKLKKEIEISERSIKELHEKKQKIQLSKDLIEAEEIRNQQKKKAV